LSTKNTRGEQGFEERRGQERRTGITPDGAVWKTTRIVLDSTLLHGGASSRR
jgi:hypothetical protein